MLKIGNKIKFESQFENYTGYILNIKSRPDNNPRVGMVVLDSFNCMMGVKSFYLSGNYDILVGEVVEFDGESTQESFSITKLDDGEEFYDQLGISKIGTRIITNDYLYRFDGQPMHVTGYAYSDVSRDLYYVALFDDGAHLEETYGTPSSDLSGEWYIPVNKASAIDNSYVTPRIKEYRCCRKCSNEFEYFGGEELCPVCIKREYVTPYHRLAPPLKFFSVNGAKAQKFFGVELEVELGGESDAEAGAVVRSLRRPDGSIFAYVSHDSSLNSGFEIITQPATIGYHRSLEDEYKNIFKKLVKDGYRGHNCQNAGIHVHVNRTYFGETEDEQEFGITRLLLLVEKFWDEIKIFSRRDYDKAGRWTRKISNYTYDESIGGRIKSNIDDYMEAYNKSNNHDGHYYAVNVANQDTIELRMFRSTLNVNTFMCTLEFVNSLVEAAKNKTTEEIFEMPFTDLLNARTREYYNSRLELTKFEEV